MSLNFKNWLLEATVPYVDKRHDPALLTYQEFIKEVNPRNKRHSSEAYNWSLKDLYQKKENYPTLLYRKSIGNIYFEFRMKENNLYKDAKFMKISPDGEVVRIDGEIQYFTEKELEERDPHGRFKYDFGVFDKDQCVAVAQDEWGALLVAVAQEYRGFGLGPVLAKLAWEKEPGKDTGGVTPAGSNMVKRAHAEFVKEYLQKGIYSYLVNQGKMTTKRVKEIIDSVGLKDEKKPIRDVGSDNPENWLLYHVGSAFIIYDKKLKDLYEDEDLYWKEKCIKAMGDVGPMMHTNKGYRLRILGGDNEDIIKFIMYCCVSWTSEDKNSLYVYPEDLKYVDKNLMDLNFKNNDKNGWVSLKGKPANYQPLASKEAKWRKSFDRYDQFKTSVIEIATAKYQEQDQ